MEPFLVISICIVIGFCVITSFEIRIVSYLKQMRDLLEEIKNKTLSR
ncbi:MAG: hypothetical protein JW800_03180 [Candidatus Omnitrophica bacterium]|nr:hypothetical protein [Candidatus Omnitrophota bacterium]